MSKNLEKVIQRAISDAAFRRQLQSNPEAALRGFKLTQDEVAALRGSDAGKLTSLGIDQRMSKMFLVGAVDGVTRSSTGDLGTSGSVSDKDLRLNSEVTPGYTTGSNQALDQENVSGASRVVTGSASGSMPAFDPGVAGDSSSVGDPRFEGSASSVLRDPENPANARGYIGGQAAPSSDAIEDQSHSFAASRNQGVSSSDSSSVLRDPENPANARGYIGHETTSSATASNIGDPDNPGSARTYAGDQVGPSSDALEDQSHGFAATRSADVTGGGLAAPIEGSPEEFAFRDQGASTNASRIGDPDNPASARGYVGDQAAAPTSDALEDQSHSFAAHRSDAFMTEGEVSQYSATTDPNLSSDQAEDLSHQFNPSGLAATPDDTGNIAHPNEPDIPT